MIIHLYALIVFYLDTLSPTKQYLKCAVVNVSNAGAGVGVYHVSSDHTSWAPGRQVYQHEKKHRWDRTIGYINFDFCICSFIFWVSGGDGWSMGQKITNDHDPGRFKSD